MSYIVSIAENWIPFS